MPKPHWIQLAVDTRDAHTLADWWAETLGWIVEPSDPAFIRKMIDEGFATEDETQEHNGRLVWRGAAAICPPDEVGKVPRRRILFQDVPEQKSVKNRVHWDVETAGGDIDAIRDELVARGAAYQASHSQGPHTWHVLTDPEGNEFCVA